MDGAAVADGEPHRTRGGAVRHDEIGDAQIADAADARLPLTWPRKVLTPPGRWRKNRHSSSAAGHGPARALGGCGRPRAAPSRHAIRPGGGCGRPVLAQQSRKPLVAQAAPGGDRVGEMMAPMVGHLVAERHRDRHLRHHRGAAAADQAAIDQQHAAHPPRRRRSRRTCRRRPSRSPARRSKARTMSRCHDCLGSASRI